MRNFRYWTRFFLNNIAEHVEGTLYHLATGSSDSDVAKPLGQLTHQLRNHKVINEELASDFLKFNKVVAVPAKHITAKYYSPKPLRTRTFSVNDAALAFIMMRNLSRSLFELLEVRGVHLPQGWKEFKQEWLEWNVRADSIAIS